ncbi:protein EARLY FLOWERING 3-like [Cynara cardunculus var. scolymus]|uniref:protein EARLY FLOWERING 3-like n=1 Tax=Cynara cardunculus var. scolymus TaxID=59895 RepID=UPI000D62793C|nr:protein EARLY FLOWERING 3-like [Cynara cardunculus var. scolymus]
MKRGVDEKNMWPIFPRLHVNDAEKGGPRAPPRNKMALYEQLSIRSSQVSANLLHGDMSKRGSFLPLQRTPTMDIADKKSNQYFDLNNQIRQREQKKKQKEDDFRASVFAQQSEINLEHSDPINGDVVSGISMVDSISGDDISPDNAIGIMGQNQFLKARRAIVNQRNAFSGQVFELHRLIKVQKLIAGFPPPMVEDDAFLGKLAKVSPIKKVHVEYALKSSTNVPNDTRDFSVKNVVERPKDDTRDFSVENTVEKAPLFSVQNNHHSTFSGYLLPPSDPNFQLPGHQWLIPIMSPSEGLIYKPYPGPGYLLPGPGPPTSAPIIGHNFVNHGVSPPTQPYQWPPGFHPPVPPTSHGFFPPYGMTTMNTSGGEEMNPFNMQCQSSGNVPIVAKFHTSNDSEVQVNIASSQSNVTRNQDTLPLFPTCPSSERGAEPTCVIRVVPHSAQSTTESVARIFQSIQERNQPNGL